MRKYIVAAMATGWIGIGFAAGNSEDQLQQYSAQGRAYMTYDFGGPRHANDAPMPLHYGLRVDSESRLAAERYTGLTDRRVPAMLQMDFAADGTRIASLNGIPFAGRTYMLRQNGTDTSPEAGSSGAATTEPGGFTWFDWSLLAVGVGGLGYIIAEVSKGKDSPDPPTTNTGTTTAGGTTIGNTVLGNTATGNVAVGNAAVGSVATNTTGTVAVGNTAVGSTVVTTNLTSRSEIRGVLPFDPESDSVEHQRWLDGGTGQMGDLGG